MVEACGAGSGEDERTDGDLSHRTFGRVFLLIGAFWLAHPLFVDVGVLGVCAALLRCLGLKGAYVSDWSALQRVRQAWCGE